MPADNPIYHIEALEYADEFYRAYQQLQPSRNITTSWPRYLLLCQAVELGLRSSPTRPRWLLRWSAASSRTGTPRFTPKRRCTVASQYDNISAKPEPRTTAETEGGPRWNGRRHFLGLGAERYRRNQQVIIDAEPPEPDRSRKG